MEETTEQTTEQPICEPVAPAVKTDRKVGKVGAYTVAAIATIFLTFQCWSADRQNKEVSPAIYLVCFSLISAALGVNVKPEELTEVVTGAVKLLGGGK